MGIEPTSSAWKAEVLPLNYTRKTFCRYIPASPHFSPSHGCGRGSDCIGCVERGPGARRTVKYACAPELAFALQIQPSPRPRSQPGEKCGLVPVEPGGDPHLLVEGVGFEPTKAEPPDLQSGPFGRSGTPPKRKRRILLEKLGGVKGKQQASKRNSPNQPGEGPNPASL